jgi:hypothetical protein
MCDYDYKMVFEIKAQAWLWVTMITRWVVEQTLKLILSFMRAWITRWLVEQKLKLS